MSEMHDRATKAVIDAGYNPATAPAIVRIVIEALREPTDAMVLASAKAAADQHYYKCNMWDRGLSDDIKMDYLNAAKHGHIALIDEAMK